MVEHFWYPSTATTVIARKLVPLLLFTLGVGLFIARLGPARALTGPIARGDRSTVAHHLEALEAVALGDLMGFYGFMGLKTLDLALQDVLREPEKAEALRKVLEKTTIKP